MPTSYDADYYENGIVSGKSLYSNYRWIPELTLPMCCELKTVLGLAGNKVLDYGCAKGYLVKGFRLLGVDAWGYDISKYAIKNAPHEIKPYLTTEMPGNAFEWVIAKDVLEHLSKDDLKVELHKLRCEKLFIAVPLGDGKKYNVPAYELDKTHVIREPLQWWEQAIHDGGFTVTYSAYKFGSLKNNWAEYPTGNGFIIGERR